MIKLPASSKQRALWALAALTILGLLLRLHYQLGRSYHNDEIGTLLFIRMDYGYLLSHVQMWLTMNYFLVVLKFLTGLFGTNDPTLLLLPLTAGLGTIPLTYALARKALDAPGALAAAALVAANPFLVYYSVIIRSYSLMVFFALLLLLSYLRWRERPTIARGVLCSTAIFCMLFFQPNSSYLAAYVVLMALYDLLADKQRDLKKFCVTLVLPATVALAGLLVCYARLWEPIQAYRTEWSFTAPTAVDYLPQLCADFFGAWYGILPSLVLLGAGLRLAFRGNAVLARLALAIPLSMLFASLAGFSCFPWALSRILLYILPLALILMAAGLQSIAAAMAATDKRKTLALCSGVLLVAVAVWPRMMEFYDMSRELPVRKVAAYIQEQAKNATPDVLEMDSTGMQLRPYLPVHTVRELYRDVLHKDLENPKQRTVFLVTSNWKGYARFHDWRIKTDQPQHFIGGTQIIRYQGTGLAILQTIFTDLLRTTDNKLDPLYTRHYKALLDIYEILSPAYAPHADHGRLLDRYYLSRQQFIRQMYNPPQRLYRPE